MGRRRSKYVRLPPRLRAREKGRGKLYYYYDAGGKPRHEIPLGSDLVLALKSWSELEMDQAPVHAEVATFRYVAEKYLKQVLPKKAPRTQRDNMAELKQLYKFFDHPPAPIDGIEPQHIRQFMDWRTANGSKALVRANRERALFSHIWNYAREKGYTAKANPCAGVHGYPEPGRRTVYIEDDVYRAVWDKADQSTKDAMDLAYLSGQRPADTLRFDVRDVRDGVLQVEQRKTGTKIRMTIEGELKQLLDRIKERKRDYKVCSTALIVNENGQPLTAAALYKRFEKARAAAGVPKGAFQFRDLRAKAGTDKTDSSGDIRQAQKQLGHASVTMTEHYVRGRRGAIVKPTK